jgi:integrase
MPVVKLTKTVVEKLPHPQKGQVYYFDEKLRGFGVSVARLSKTYFAQRDVNGKTVRSTIGKHGVFTCEEAREEARQRLASMALGENVNKTKQQKKEEEKLNITFSEAIEAYRVGRKHLTKTTKYRLDCLKKMYLPGWVNLPLGEITREMVFEKHRDIGENHGRITANNVMEAVRAVYNFNKHTNDLLPPNPVSALSSAKAWYKQKRRRTVIKPTEIKRWYDTVTLLENTTIRDFLLLLLFTGMRRSEGLALRWENVDFKERTLTVPHTKNSEPLELPLSDYLHDLLVARKKRTGKSEWVFPGTGKTGHLAEPKNSMKNIARDSGVPFMLHDLRRTFVTIAESIDVPAYAIKGLVNHKTGGDVTAGYIIMTVDRLREPMQKITNHILALVNKEEEELVEEDCEAVA